MITQNGEKQCRGIVTMKTLDGANKVLANMNGKDLLGRTLHIVKKEYDPTLKSANVKSTKKANSTPIASNKTAAAGQGTTLASKEEASKLKSANVSVSNSEKSVVTPAVERATASISPAVAITSKTTAPKQTTAPNQVSSAESVQSSPHEAVQITKEAAESTKQAVASSNKISETNEAVEVAKQAVEVTEKAVEVPQTVKNTVSVQNTQKRPTQETTIESNMQNSNIGSMDKADNTLSAITSADGKSVGSETAAVVASESTNAATIAPPELIPVEITKEAPVAEPVVQVATPVKDTSVSTNSANDKPKPIGPTKKTSEPMVIIVNDEEVSKKPTERAKEAEAVKPTEPVAETKKVITI